MHVTGNFQKLQVDVWDYFLDAQGFFSEHTSANQICQWIFTYVSSFSILSLLHMDHFRGSGAFQ